MKPAALLLIAAFGIAGASAQSTAPALSSSEIAASIAGGWVYGPESDEPGICSEGEHRIWLMRDADDQLVFHEAWTGAAFDPTKSRRQHAQGVARLIPLGADPKGPGALAIRYDGERRVMANGDLVEWLLIMPDAESFYWRRRDQSDDDRTAISIRCPAARPQRAGERDAGSSHTH